MLTLEYNKTGKIQAPDISGKPLKRLRYRSGEKVEDRLQLIRERVLGELLQVHYGFIKPANGKITLVFYKASIELDDLLCYNNLEELGLLTLKFTLSPEVLEEAARQEKHWKQAEAMSLTGPIGGTLRARSELAKLKKVVSYLKKSYKLGDEIDEEDRQMFQTDDLDLSGYIYVNLSFNKDKVAEYINKYATQYYNKELDGQEKLPLPRVIATSIWNKIADPKNLELYGSTRLYISSDKTNPIPMFCHSLLFLLLINRIKLHKLEVYGNHKFEAVVDFLELVEVATGTGTNQPKPTPLPDDCEWDDDAFICGDKKLPFGKDDKNKDYFKLLTDNHGLAVTNESCYKKFNYLKPSDISRGVKRDLTDRLKKEGLLRWEENPKGRIEITAAGVEPGGYTCLIHSKK